MKVSQIPVGRMQNFTYVVYDEPTLDAVIIDPSWDLHETDRVILGHRLTVEYIVNTHHHFDHTLGNKALAESTGARIVQHEESDLAHDISIKDGDTVRFGGSELAVLHTPGHSRDSICLVGDGKIFSGDTLFVGACGRVDLPGGSASELHSSLRRLAGLPDHLTVYPGHHYGTTATSTIGREKSTNIAMQAQSEEDFLRMMGL